MADLTTHLIGSTAGGLGLLPLAQVVVDASEQRGQPAGNDQEFAVLVEGDPAAEEAVDLGEAFLGAVAQSGGGDHGVGAAQQVHGFGQGFQGSGANVGGLELLGQFHGAVQVGFGPKGVHGRHDGGLDETALAAPLRAKSQILRLQTGRWVRASR
ncbi:hypothetical protein [Streptosporangium saharense]|uniref:hypothetical protein n=1 Tax=Streptosporangium saharense TaxID=1706840 RepID=UPI0036D00F59